jgi:hypothetical protein
MPTSADVMYVLGRKRLSSAHDGLRSCTEKNLDRHWWEIDDGRSCCAKTVRTGCSILNRLQTEYLLV